MSIEAKIKELLTRKSDEQLNEEGAAPMGAANVSKDTSIKAANQGDTTMPRQGSSQDAEYEERDEKEENQGSVVSKSTPNAPRPQHQGAGQAPNYTTTGDPASVVNMQASSGNKPMGEETKEVSTPSLKEQLSAIFGDDLSEDFRDKATAIFEAAVIARVNEEMDKVVAQLEEEKQQELEDIAEGLIDKVDSFMNYVVEQWMDENKLAVDGGLRTEIAEDFIAGLKTLFQENYIDIPEEKVDVVETLSAKTDELEEKLNESTTKNIELTEELSSLRKAIVLSEMSGDLADTEADKLKKLVEGVQFDSDELFREKVKVIKENYFPKVQKSSPEEQILNEEAPVQSSNDSMSKYVQALSRAIKAR
jgi:hypothetical protein